MELSWYNSLNKPFLNPPSWIFAPVWGILYILMFVGFWIMIYSNSNYNKKWAIVFFIIQLLFNFSWSPIFFYFHNIKLAFVIILLLLIFICLTTYSFFKISKLSAYLLIPYFLWTIFAAYLNFEYIRINL